jgi:hypothetical protein
MLQLLIYPSIYKRLGTLNCYRALSLVFPIAYFVAPFLVAVQIGQDTITTATNILLWIGIAIVLLVHLIARIFAMPASITLLNNCIPHPSTLATIHGIGQTTSAAFRTIGPVVAGYLYGIGNSLRAVGFVWWTMCVMAMIAWLVSLFIREGSGYEILMPSMDDSSEIEA